MSGEPDAGCNALKQRVENENILTNPTRYLQTPEFIAMESLKMDTFS